MLAEQKTVNIFQEKCKIQTPAWYQRTIHEIIKMQ